LVIGLGHGLFTYISFYSTVYTPLVPGATKELSEPADNTGVHSVKTCHHPVVLVVDDDPWFRVFVRKILEESACVVVEAESVEEGEHMLHTITIDLLIADIMLPGVPGFSIIASAKREFPALKIIAVSGIRSDNASFRMARLAGADTALGKPFPAELLKQSILPLLS